MINNATGRVAQAFDIENGAVRPASSNTCKNALVATCATLAAGLGAVGGMLLLGATARVGPFAVPHDYGTTCYQSLITGQSLGCGQEDNSSNTATTRGFFGVATLVVAGVLAGCAVKLAKTQTQRN